MIVNKLLALRAAEEGMDREQQRHFEDYFLGAISVLCSEKDWNLAIKSAETCFRRRMERSDLVVVQNNG